MPSNVLPKLHCTLSKYTVSNRAMQLSQKALCWTGLLVATCDDLSDQLDSFISAFDQGSPDPLKAPADHSGDGDQQHCD